MKDITYNEKLKLFINEIGGSEEDFLNHEIQRLQIEVDEIEEENKDWRDHRDDLQANYKALHIYKRIQECEDLIFDYETRLYRLFPEDEMRIIKQYNSESFELFSKVKHNEINDYDMIMLLRDYSKNYDIELLKSLSKDISFYLFVEIDEKEAEFSPQDIQDAIDKRKENGLEIPYIKPREYKDLTEKQKETRKRMKLNGAGIQSKPIINKEVLLFEFDFYNVRMFQYKIYTKIKELQGSISNDFSNITFNILSTELIELVKGLIENGSVKGTQKDIINAFSNFCNLEIKHPSKLINDIKNTRNNGKETLFLDKLKTSLLSYIRKEKTR